MANWDEFMGGGGFLDDGSVVVLLLDDGGSGFGKNVEYFMAVGPAYKLSSDYLKVHRVM